MEKALERQSGINWHFLYENNGNKEKREVKYHRFHLRRSMKENNGK